MRRTASRASGETTLAGLPCAGPWPRDQPGRRTAGGHAPSRSEGRQAERNPLACMALGLAVQRLMPPVLLEQDHRPQARAGPATGDHMKGGWRLADLLAVAAGEFLWDMLDHPGLRRGRLFHRRAITSSVSVTSSPGLRNRGLPLAQAGLAPTASGEAKLRWEPQHRQVVGPGSITRSRRRCSGKGCRAGRLRVNDTTLVVFAAARSAAIASSLAEPSSSSNAGSIRSSSRTVRSERGP